MGDVGRRRRSPGFCTATRDCSACRPKSAFSGITPAADGAAPDPRVLDEAQKDMLLKIGVCR